MRWLKGICLALLSHTAIASGGASVELEQFTGRLCDDASLQRGAGAFMQYCQGCHSLQYMRFDSLGQGIGITDESGELMGQLIKDNLNFIAEKNSVPIGTAIPAEDAEKWFGIAPPDLTLVARVRGTDWLYSYLKGFYQDDNRPWGVNNRVYPDVGMPHVLLSLQGTQKAVYRTEQGADGSHQVVDHLVLDAPGLLSEGAYDTLVTDLVNFLDFAAEPHRLERERLGGWVLLFLLVFLVFAYLLKREYWKDIH